ncbi:cyclophilin-like fold protein [Candidatus Latescibacterota bacterium]
MSANIVITIDNESVRAELNDSQTSEQILAKLPIESDFSTWGDEIYFSIPVQMGSENGKEIVELGELGYWPPGNAFCIFYGATPESTEDEIKPASEVNPLGRILDDPKVFKRLSSASSRITIEKA